MGTGELTAGGNLAMGKHPIQGGVEIFLVASCYENRGKLRPDGPLSSYAEFLLNITKAFKNSCQILQEQLSLSWNQNLW